MTFALLAIRPSQARSETVLDEILIQTVIVGDHEVVGVLSLRQLVEHPPTVRLEPHDFLRKPADSRISALSSTTVTRKQPSVRCARSPPRHDLRHGSRGRGS